MNAVIVEDDPMVMEINKRYLENFPQIEVKKMLKNGREALTYLKNTITDLALVDVYMPEMDGVTLLQEIRGANIPVDVIMVTAANDVRYVKEMLRLGIVDYLIKPFEYERFRQAIEKYLQKMSLLYRNVPLNQVVIDSIVSPPPSIRLPDKGLQRRTLELVLDCLKEGEYRYYTCEEVAAKINLSTVTTRRYLNYLAEYQEIDGAMDYETGGRPGMRYRRFKKE